MARRAILTSRFRYSSASFFCSSKSQLPLASQFSTYASPSPPPTTAASNASAASTTLFVAGLNKKTSSQQLYKAFSKFGEPQLVRVVTDRESGLSRGFGFVTYANLEDSAKGLEGMDLEELDGWTIFVEYARPKAPPAHLAYDQS
ncbi:RNA-binding (RRM/RBD/RNP motifs) family protein [Euphorbia peplus]|nr:RNA-binding (RRM/RBD/RNP motifs) family protein [Euphorbia peplus]